MNTSKTLAFSVICVLPASTAPKTWSYRPHWATVVVAIVWLVSPAIVVSYYFAFPNDISCIKLMLVYYVIFVYDVVLMSHYMLMSDYAL